MDATAILARVAVAIERHKLDAVLIGNAAAAIHGAPVTTLDFDFLMRRSPANRKKIAGIASDLGATAFRPYYPVSNIVRLMNDDETLQVDFMDSADGVRSYESIRSRAEQVRMGSAAVRVAGLADIIKMKRAANRPRDRAVLHILEKTLEAVKAASEKKGAES